MKRRLKGTLPVWLPETLFALAKTDFSIRETADTLHLHRNSLANRIKKIEDILGLDILKESTWKDYIRVFAYYLNQTVYHTQQP